MTNRRELADRLIGYAVHDDTCTTTRFPGQGVCSCGLSSAIQDARLLREPVAGEVEELRAVLTDLDTACPGLKSALTACQTDARELVADLDGQMPIALVKSDIFAKLEFPALFVQQAQRRLSTILRARYDEELKGG